MFVYTEIHMTISERIFKILKEREISQASFCKMIGLSGSTVSDWKTKRPIHQQTRSWISAMLLI